MTRINKAIGSLSGWVYFFLVGIIIYEIILRYVFNSPTSWVLELSIALAGVQYLIAGAFAHAEQGHVRIDVLYRLFPERFRRVADLLSEAIIALVCAAFVYAGYLQARNSLLAGETSGSAWNSHAPMIMKIAIPVAAFLLLLQSLAHLLEMSRNRRG